MTVDKYIHEALDRLEFYSEATAFLIQKQGSTITIFRLIGGRLGDGGGVSRLMN
jgi:hypothetical protein